MGTTVYAQPTKLDQVAGVLRLGDFKPPPEKPLTDDDVYGNGPGGPAVGGPQASAPPQMLSDADVYANAPDESLGGVAAQFGSGAVRGLASLPGLPADLATLGFIGAEYLAGTKPEDRTPQANLPWAPFGSETFRTMVDRNLPLVKRDESGGPGSYAETIGEFAGPGAATGAGLLRRASSAVARGTAGTISRAVAAHPGRFIAGETAATLGGGGLSEAGRQADPSNPWLAAAGGLVGSVAPGGVMAGLRGLVRGGPAGGRQIENALQDFQRIGQTPTLSQATQGRYSAGQLMSRILEFTPGGILPTKGRLQSQIDAAGSAIDQAIARGTQGLGSSEQAAGDALQHGARRFADKVSRTQASLERRLDNALSPQTIVQPNETLQALQRIYAPAAGGPGGTISEVGAASVPNTARDMLRHVLGDVNAHGGTPFRSLVAFRTWLGAKTSTGNALIRDMSDAQTNMLYGAITRDMEHAADANGAGAIVRLRNSYYSQRRTQIDDVFNPRIQNPQTVEGVYRSVKNADTSQLTQIMRQMTPAQRRTVVGQVLHEIGLPRAGQSTGDTQHFSMETFDTNFEKLNRKGTLDALFNLSGTQDLRTALNDVGRVAEQFKGSEHFLRNPSGTASVGMQYSGPASVAGAAWVGGPIAALKMAAIVYGVPYALIRGGNSAAFLRLMSETGQVTNAGLPGLMARMANFARFNPEYAPAIKQILQQAQPQQPQSPQQQSGEQAHPNWTGSGGPEIAPPNYGPHNMNGFPYDAKDITRNVQGERWPHNQNTPAQAAAATAQSDQARAELAAMGPSPMQGDPNSPMAWASRGAGDRSEIIPGQRNTQDALALLKSMNADYAQLRQRLSDARGVTPEQARGQEQRDRGRFSEKVTQMRVGNQSMNELERAHQEEQDREYQRKIDERRKMIAALLADLTRMGRHPAEVPHASAPRNF